MRLKRQRIAKMPPTPIVIRLAIGLGIIGIVLVVFRTLLIRAAQG